MFGRVICERRFILDHRSCRSRPAASCLAADQRQRYSDAAAAARARGGPFRRGWDAGLIDSRPAVPARASIGRSGEAQLMNAVQYEVKELRDLAQRARDLADRAKVPYRRDQLHTLAEEYDAKADAIERTGKLPETSGS